MSEKSAICSPGEAWESCTDTCCSGNTVKLYQSASPETSRLCSAGRVAGVPVRGSAVLQDVLAGAKDAVGTTETVDSSPPTESECVVSWSMNDSTVLAEVAVTV